jgi:hypothetical protein
VKMAVNEKDDDEEGLKIGRYSSVIGLETS